MQGQDSRVHNRVVRNGVPTPRAAIAVRPFRSAEEAWLWTMAALQARRDGARYTANRGLVSRPCEPDDVIRCLDALYRRRRIDLARRWIGLAVGVAAAAYALYYAIRVGALDSSFLSFLPR